jgi:hypothetical protein
VWSLLLRQALEQQRLVAATSAGAARSTLLAAALQESHEETRCAREDVSELLA